MADMDVDGLTPVVGPGLKGVAGHLLDRLEREARAEAAERERLESERNSTAARPVSAGDPAVGYVPGGKKSGGQSSHASNTISTTAPPLRNSVSSSIAVPVPVNVRKADPPAVAATDTSQPPPLKKARIQPTIRMTFQWKPYPTGRDPLAKHVPIFNILDIAEKKGLLLLPATEEKAGEGDEAEADAEGGSGDEEDDDDIDNANTTKQDANVTDIALGDTDMAAVSENDAEARQQAAIDAAVKVAKKAGHSALKLKKRILDRDEGYDVEDEFVDDSEMAINEPKYQPKPKVDGYCAITGIVEVHEDDASGKRGGRKAGSVNKPKVAVKMADGSTRMISEALAAREVKKQARINGSPNPAAASPGPVVSSSKALASPAASLQYVQALKGKAHAGPASSVFNDFTAAASSPASHSARVSASVSNQQRESTPSSNSEYPGMFTGGATPSGIGSQMVPIDLADDDNDDAIASTVVANKRNQPVISFDPSPAGRNKYTYGAVSAPLRAKLDILEDAISKESFAKKSKFPPNLKPPLIDAALTAMESEEYDENFFNIMPNIFPYNRFTMNKLIKREVCEPRVQRLEKLIEIETQIFKAEIDRTVTACLPQHEAALKQYELDLAEWVRMHPHANDTSNIGDAVRANSSAGQASTQSAINGRVERANSLTPVASDGDASMADKSAIDNATPKGADDAPKKPKPRFKWTDVLRSHLFTIMTYQSEIITRQKEKADVEGGNEPSMNVAVRERYARLVTLWPPDWMSSNILSRELTQLKRKVEKRLNGSIR